MTTLNEVSAIVAGISVIPMVAMAVAWTHANNKQFASHESWTTLIPKRLWVPVVVMWIFHLIFILYFTFEPAFATPANSRALCAVPTSILAALLGRVAMYYYFIERLRNCFAASSFKYSDRLLNGILVVMMIWIAAVTVLILATVRIDASGVCGAPTTTVLAFVGPDLLLQIVLVFLFVKRMTQISRKITSLDSDSAANSTTKSDAQISTEIYMNLSVRLALLALLAVVTGIVGALANVALGIGRIAGVIDMLFNTWAVFASFKSQTYQYSLCCGRCHRCCLPKAVSFQDFLSSQTNTMSTLASEIETPKVSEMRSEEISV